ncbi:unnamed protein product [Adineta steineri]|uniref:Retrotransposon gag domain-containing protein n=1 Tax=Adineta steineri TaxID=433720 RepID=A0A819VCI8_9BILA|nr:unnamed protein product [Adineta steineri]
MSVDPILNQGADPERIRQFFSNQEEGVLEPVADIPTKDILEELGDNFTPKQTDEPSESDWDTTPATSTIKFFGGMADKERRRKGLFGDDKPEGVGEDEGNVNDNAEQEVTFSYNYVNDAQKLKLFLATLKDSALRWFMGLGEHTIRSWDEMKTTFLRKYQEYCKSKDSRNDIFKMQQQEDGTLEDYVGSLCVLCEKDHETDNCPSQPELQAIYKGASEATSQATHRAQKKPWKARPQGIFVDPYLQFNPYTEWNQWQPMNGAWFQNQPFLNQP